MRTRHTTDSSSTVDDQDATAAPQATLRQRLIGTYQQFMVQTHELRESDNKIEHWTLIVVTGLFVAMANVGVLISGHPLAIGAALGGWIVPFALWRAEKARPREPFPTRAQRPGYVRSLLWILLALGYLCLVAIVASTLH